MNYNNVTFEKAVADKKSLIAAVRNKGGRFADMNVSCDNDLYYLYRTLCGKRRLFMKFGQRGSVPVVVDQVACKAYTYRNTLDHDVQRLLDNGYLRECDVEILAEKEPKEEVTVKSTLSMRRRKRGK